MRRKIDAKRKEKKIEPSIWVATRKGAESGEAFQQFNLQTKALFTLRFVKSSEGSDINKLFAIKAKADFRSSWQFSIF